MAWRWVALGALIVLLALFGLPTSPRNVAASLPIGFAGERTLGELRAPNAPGTLFLPFVQGGIAGALKPKITHLVATLPQALEPSIGSFCNWGFCSIGPRLYHEPLTNGNTLVGWTDASGNGHVSVLNGNSIVQTWNFAGQYVRGLTAHSDGKFAILLWDPNAKIMWLAKHNADGSQVWKSSVDGSLTSYNGSWVGDSRLTYGNSKYAAYFAVHGDSGWVAGHEGDQLTYVNDSGVVQAGGWEWGCSHSMAELINYHPGLLQFVPVCASDCYNSKGILLNDNQVVYAGDGNCGGSTSAQLGQIAHAGTTWKLVFSALNRPGYVGHGVGLATINSAFTSSYVWLTNTTGDYERDPSLARLGATLTTNRYLVGWTTTNNALYWLGVVDGNGSFLVDPEEVSSLNVAWGNRDDSFRTRADGTVSWVQGNANSTALHFFRFNGASWLP